MFGDVFRRAETERRVRDNEQISRIRRELVALVPEEVEATGNSLEGVGEPMAAAMPESVDIAIVTILGKEYQEVYRRLLNPARDPGSASQPNRYAWVVGQVPYAAGQQPYRVVLAMAAVPGNVSGNQVVAATIQRWKPRYVVLVGKAGGFQRDGLQKGDVVVSDVIWGYEYGKIGEQFQPRRNFTYQADTALLTNALAFSVTNESWTEGLPPAPDPVARPKMLTGLVASGDKVIDNLDHPFWMEVAQAEPKLLAVEMEGAGAAAAHKAAQEDGQFVGFIMIRSISDMPRNMADVTSAASHGGLQTEERDSWEQFAAAAAASFAVAFIAYGWPMPPREAEAPARGDEDPERLPLWVMNDTEFSRDEQVVRLREAGWAFRAVTPNKTYSRLTNGWQYVVWHAPNGQLHRLCNRIPVSEGNYYMMWKQPTGG